ncbi:hypothetical protein C2G38_2196255 [Gigaspora rosea]|uniref:Uncharacterized protein n=1 Tax=Gigaspora rosea TaxID=44941 RepID=A0A397UV84_9GLOM|nr:hypothetical protein C2G38_2196255 [Gigaspora rosea]
MFPLPKFVSYPKKYNAWKELLKPASSCFTKFTNPSFYKTWNNLDTSISTVTIAIYWLHYGSVSVWTIAFTTLLLEIKFILFFLCIPFFGVYLAMIISTIDNIISFLIMFECITLAFAHLLYFLLNQHIQQTKVPRDILNVLNDKIDDFDEIHKTKEMKEAKGASLNQKSQKIEF